jgi:hypothetical protein
MSLSEQQKAKKRIEEEIASIEEEMDIERIPTLERKKFQKKTGNHDIHRNAQRKMEFADHFALLEYIKNFDTMPAYVLIAGAGPGSHYVQLIKRWNNLAVLFNVQTEWHLYDPLGFCPALQELSKDPTHFIFLNYKKFDTDIARSWFERTHKKQPLGVLFLSDCRNPAHRHKSNYETRKQNYVCMSYAMIIRKMHR